MDIRSPMPPDQGPGDESPRDAGSTPATPAGSSAERPDRVSFSVPTRVIVAKFAVAGLIGLVAAFAPQTSQVVVGLLAAAGTLGYAGRDLIARERLRADGHGLVAVHGYAGRRSLPWVEIERIRIDTRARLGARTSTLEIDAGDEIFLYSRHDLGVDAEDALAALQSVRG